MQDKTTDNAVGHFTGPFSLLGAENDAENVTAGKHISEISLTGKLDCPAPYSYALDWKMDYDSIFSIVRKAVRYVLNKERSGLGLMLSDLPPELGAFWEVGGNYIVLNETLVELMRKMARSAREFNSYVFVVLAHEYLHAIGYIDETDVRRVTAAVTNKAMGEDHPAALMASGDMWAMYPFLRLAGDGRGRNTRIVGRFDSESTRTYIW